MRKFLLALFVVGFTMVGFSAVSYAAPKDGKGANQTGDFTPTDPKTTDPSNDHGNRPEDGSVGNADDKNPPGQSKNDKNSGYECDKNNGVGKGNPAHSACASTTTVKDNTTSTTVKGTTTTTVKRTDYPGGTVPPREDVGTSVFLERVNELKAKQAAGVVLTPEEEELVEGLARTGPTDWLAPLAFGLILMGIAITGLARQPRLAKSST